MAKARTPKPRGNGKRSQPERALEARLASKESISIGIVTAIPKEFAAMQLMLDGAGEVQVPGQGGGTRYVVGSVPARDGASHMVTLCFAGMGNNAASIRASRLLDHFPQVEDVIMVGIAGGVPNINSPEDHVRLGDIVVSDLGGVVQYDHIKDVGFVPSKGSGAVRRDGVQGNFVRSPRGSSHRPSARLIEAVRFLEVEEQLGREPWLDHIGRARTLKHSKRPPSSTDVLVSASNPAVELSHPSRSRAQPRVLRGTVASANVLLKDPERRDELGRRGVRAIEMEGSGIQDAAWTYGVGYLVVRGICDYCDSRKNDQWQGYAAVVAAAFVRALLESMPVSSRQQDALTLAGTWHGELRSDWTSPDGSPLPPFDAFLLIRPAPSGLSCNLMTVKSRSRSLVAVMRPEDEGSRTLIIAYQNEPQMNERHKSPMHHGVMQLRVPNGGRPSELLGGYWTDRKTMGDARFTFFSEHYFDTFAAAAAAHGKIRSR